ncbi:MAG: TRAP transporter substrate-binding protein DctP [Acidobacteria bacterium]|nr:TRAP transporter substrate-binding protein DctP [Acidobacteriota bacterium]
MDYQKPTLYRTVTGILFIALFLTGLTPWAAAQSSRVKLATLVPRGTSYHQALQFMAEKWRQAPGGGVRVTIYTDGTMGGEADMVRRMRIGQLQAGMLTVVGLSEIDPSVTALQNMPLMFRSLDEVDYIREKLRSRIEKTFYDKGFVVLFWGDAGWVHFFSKTPVLFPDDLKKLKLFTWAGDNRQLELMKSAGYQAVPLETNDILPGLQTGLIEALPTTPFIALASQFYSSAPYMLDLEWAPLVGGTVITRKFWDTLAPATQEALREAAAETGRAIKARGRQEMEESIATMKQRGLTVTAVTPEAEATWRTLAEDVYPKIRGTIVPADMFDEVRQLLADYRQKNQAN